MRKNLFPKELRAVMIAVIALAAFLTLLLAITGRRMVKTDVAGAQARMSETFTYGKYGALYRYDGSRTRKLAALPYADTDETTVPYLVDWADVTSDEKTVYFIDMDESYDGKLYRARIGGDDSPEKIASHLVQYVVCGDDVFYLKASGALYKNEDRLAGDIAELNAVSFDSKRVLALDSEDRLFLIPVGKEDRKKRVDRDVTISGALDEELNRIWYITADDSLFIYDFSRDLRTFLGEYAWDEAVSDPDRDSLFYHVYDEDGDDLGLYYYDADSASGKSIAFSDGDTVISLGSELIENGRMLYAVVSDEDGELDLKRCFMRDGAWFAPWETAAKDLEEEPSVVVVGGDGTLYYLQGAYAESEASWFGWPVYDDEDALYDVEDEGELYADSTDLNITASDIFYGDGALYIVSDADDESMTFTLSVLDGTRARRIADDVYIYRVLPGGTIVTLRDFSERRGEGDLYLTAGGRDKLIDRDVLWFSDARY